MKNLKRAAALVLALALALACFGGCKKKTEAEKLSRSYNVVISVELTGELAGKKLELEWSVNGLNAGTKVAWKTEGGYHDGDVVNFRLMEDDLKKGMNVMMRVVLLGYDGVGIYCGQSVPLELKFGEVYYLRVSGTNASDAVTEQIFPE
jgi:hypothetical protein